MNRYVEMMTRAAAVVLILVPLAACALSGRPSVSSPELKGRVIEKSTNKPIPNAIVVIQWTGTLGGPGHGSTVCYHVASTMTNEVGEYAIAAWKKSSPYGTITYRQARAMAYKEGYEGVGGTRESIFMQQFEGASSERLEYLSRMAISCSDKAEIEIKLLPLYKALYQEANEIAVTNEDKLKVLYRLRDVERLELGSDVAWNNFRRRQAELQ